MSEKNKIRSTIGFKILKALKKNNIEELIQISKSQSQKDLDNFDAITQNLIILEYLFSKNMYLYINE